MPRNIGAVLLGVLLLATGLAQPAAAVQPPDAETARMEAEADPARIALWIGLAERGGRLERHGETGQLRFVGGRGGRPLISAADLGHPADAPAAAGRFLGRFGSLFGLGDSLFISSDAAFGGGYTVRHQQVHRGVPVLGGDLLVRITSSGDVSSANGEASPSLRLDTRPAIPAAEAAQAAERLTARRHGLPAGSLSASPPTLWIHDPRLLGGPPFPAARLVWRTEVRAGPADPVRELVMVDARTGGLVLQSSQVAHAAPAALQRLCDQRSLRSPQRLPCRAAHAEGGLPGKGSADAKRAHEHTDATWRFLHERFERDSLDGQGRRLISTVRYCPPGGGGSCPYPNAFWNGHQMTYGVGYAQADDVVAHELVHGFTEHTSDLFYYYQSGAINEALSDIFGEFIDQDHDGAFDDDSAGVAWLIGEDLPGGAIRDMADPPSIGGPGFAQPDRMQSSFYFPDYQELDNGGVHINSGVANKAAYLMAAGTADMSDGSAGPFNGQTIVSLGRDKTAALWYAVATTSLGTASDYADLADALRQRCVELAAAGVVVKDGDGAVSGTFVSKDCAQVEKVLLATEMDLPPVMPGVEAIEAPVCETGDPVTVFLEDVEEDTAGRWKVPASQGPVLWTDTEGYAHGGGWSFYGADASTVADSRLQMRSAVRLPGSAFLHFHHAFGFDDGFGATQKPRHDGGVIEYKAGSGPWLDARILFDHNGYNGRVEGGLGNPLAGRRAFTSESGGYMSSRLDLAPLAGDRVRFRFRIGTDSAVGDLGWLIDDIHIYTCAG